MNKILLIVLVGLILLSGTLIAGTVFDISLSDVTIPKKTTINSSSQEVSYKCGNDKFTITLNEPDGVIDMNDLSQAIHCDDEIKDIEYNGKKLKQNKYGDIGFDEDDLKKKECLKDGNIWVDKKCEEYVEPIIEEPKEEPFEEINDLFLQ